MNVAECSFPLWVGVWGPSTVDFKHVWTNILRNKLNTNDFFARQFTLVGSVPH
jgi:hypothetical protein